MSLKETFWTPSTTRCLQSLTSVTNFAVAGIPTSRVLPSAAVAILRASESSSSSSRMARFFDVAVFPDRFRAASLRILFASKVGLRSSFDVGDLGRFSPRREELSPFSTSLDDGFIFLPPIGKGTERVRERQVEVKSISFRPTNPPILGVLRRVRNSFRKCLYLFLNVYIPIPYSYTLMWYFPIPYS